MAGFFSSDYCAGRRGGVTMRPSMEPNVIIAIMLAPLGVYLFRRYLGLPIARGLMRRYGHSRIIRFLTKEREGL